MNKTKIIGQIFLLLLIILFFYLPIMIDMLPKTHFTYVLGLIMCSSILIFIIFSTYKDIRNKKYSTNTFIVLTDVIMILALASSLLIEYKSYNIVDIMKISYYYNIENKIDFAFFIGLFFNQFLREDKFIKPIQ